jgi:hypothetical protein
MATEKFDGYARVDMIMKKADSTQEDIKEAYSVWSKTYDEVTINSGSNEDHRECMRVGSHASLVSCPNEVGTLTKPLFCSPRA